MSTAPPGTARTSTAPAGAEPLTRRRRWTILAVCALSMFLVGLDTTIVNVALPSIGAGLHADTRALEWVVDAYTLVLASLLISSGATADRSGRRRVFRIGLAVFGLASLACAAAPTVGALVAARAAQGVGASMLSPVALAVVVNAMPDPRERARAIGVWASVFGLSMATGPAVGGMLIDALGWRAVFWVNAPLVLLALVLAGRVLPESRAAVARALDLPGQVLMTVLVAASVAALIEGPHLGWTAPVLLVAYAVAAFALITFVAVERRRREPMIDLVLFRRRTFLAAFLAAFAVFVGLSGTLLLNTLYLQHARGWTPLHAGLATLPMAVGATVCAPLAGNLAGRIGARVPLLVAGTCYLAGGLVLTRLTDGTGLATLLTSYLLIGIGFGFANAPVTTIAVGGLPPARAGVAGAITSTARQLGAAAGIALAGGLLAGATTPAGLAAATHPGWLVVAGCGVVLLAAASTARRPGAA
ncbi:MAG TPA: DHA2 family efflux MFS transporter permease subunit [Cellulomonas sp.]